MKSNLDLVNDCDSFPYYERDPETYIRLCSSYWKFELEGGRGPHGFILPDTFEKMPWGDIWDIDHAKRRIMPASRRHSDIQQTDVIRETLERAKAKDIFKVLRGWRYELYPIYGGGNSDELEISIERAGSPLFGVNTYGVHMTAYVHTLNEMKIWVPRRARSKQTYGGMLDNTVAGGLSTGEEPFDGLVREANEEACFSEQLVRSNAKSCGTVSYFYIRDGRAGGETGLLQPECQYVYDMEIRPDLIPAPSDNEVEEFYLWTVDEVQKALAEGQFKPNCALVILDFFIRHGILTPETEKDYIEIVSRLHRILPFPTR